MGSRYDKLFAALREKNEGAFVPFIMLGDPTPEASLDIIRTAVAAGADALELGVPFSDPVADGPTIQASHIRALDGGASLDSALDQVRKIRSEFPDLPIGMLIYGNVAFARGVEKFYAEFAEAGADSILLPDVPVREGTPFIAAAKEAGINPIFIAPARAAERTLAGVAEHSQGYIYAISRDGVTGTEKESETTGLDEVVASIQRFDGPPVLLGFGISSPQHVADAIAANAAGAITGSAITKIINRHVSRETGAAGTIEDADALHAELTEFISAMKEATKK
ncbi:MULTISPECIES: tryptophan synthase subunit alpha [Corynebacterium]|jgi:tryptophan synthase, alpha subunit|uniref:Tryptophan synthase alpha chain n=1 Tax=Corynebacterium accolens TaxID=38284 RepID=A0AAP4BXS2_9CORY|nr:MULTISPECIES: tryptophan synthase subunit alpha [Corynebacterium]ERS54756.1 tryptophan synthase alpha chain [Corynebacterium sp. KPL1824]MDK4269355.1 tryptophan synthase subunit alpha [Corynebacterium accolens]MDK4293774.1 tryptophan synthase subunit alpha [Corynebacterium accolens]MDK4332257.1 tryptophan synthase subunit alpha [Corynebacterium accolens]MDK4335086.1 tryptophan synthase subunit alpha [Corynebacterium accolens]